MGKIKQLPTHEALKIAAGEVVERPVSIVKELVENALDAGATTIDIYVEEGGKTLIRVIDNGCGMAEDDAKACFLPHATSKITGVADLESLRSFGFRGEALASIAAVSKTSLKTKTAQCAQGTHVLVERGTCIEVNQIGCGVGTDICISELFDNVPARKKFLKTVDTEWRQIVNVFQAFCLAYQHVHFRLYHFGQLAYNCPPVNDIQTRVQQLWDEHTANSLLSFSQESEHGSISGALSNHQFMRYARSHMFVFVNNRWVKNNALLKAVMKGYESVLQPGKFPAVFLYLTVDPSLVDVNIHPRKEEVQLVHSKQLESIIFTRVKETLASQIRAQDTSILMPALRLDRAPQAFDYQPNAGQDTGFIGALKAPFIESAPFEYQTDTVFTATVASIQPASETLNTQQVLVQEPSTILAQLHKTYILVEKPSGLWMVDQHAAHERILYESFKARFTDVAATRLMFPQRIAVDTIDQRILTPHLPLLLSEGLEIEVFDEQTLVVYATPSYAKDLDLTAFVQECIHNIKELAHLDQKAIIKSLKEKVHAMMACKAAIKAGDTLDLLQMTDLIKKLEVTDNKLTCPHGRPTAWTIRSYEIEKNFKRIV